MSKTKEKEPFPFLSDNRFHYYGGVCSHFEKCLSIEDMGITVVKKPFWAIHEIR